MFSKHDSSFLRLTNDKLTTTRRIATPNLGDCQRCTRCSRWLGFNYDLSQSNAVKMTLYGGVVDPAYSRLLIQKTDLPLVDVLALDRVQKKLPIPDEAATRLRKAGLIEGRKPNFHVSALVANATASKADYIRTRAQDDEFYAKLLTDYLERFGQADRAEINKLLMDKLSDALNEEQKEDEIGNLLTKLRRGNRIINTGSRSHPVWQLME